jgi:putative PIN family toxin of toxin-antitoxin system
MRLVVDTNVFISAALKQASRPASVIRWIGQHGGLLKTDATEQEVLAVLRRPRIAPKIETSFVAQIRQILVAAEQVTIVEAINACRDPDDDKFLELAVNGQADVVVSGDDDLLMLGAFRDIPIVSPAAFLEARW